MIHYRCCFSVCRLYESMCEIESCMRTSEHPWLSVYTRQLSERAEQTIKKNYLWIPVCPQLHNILYRFKADRRDSGNTCVSFSILIITPIQTILFCKLHAQNLVFLPMKINEKKNCETRITTNIVASQLGVIVSTKIFINSTCSLNHNSIRKIIGALFWKWKMEFPSSCSR